MARFLQFERVSFAYPGMAEPLLSDVTAHFPEGTWTGIVGANGAGKTTLLRLAAGEISPSGGSVRQIGSAKYAVQRTDAPSDEWDDFMDAWDPVAMDVRRHVEDEKASWLADGRAEGWRDGERKSHQLNLTRPTEYILTANRCLTPRGWSLFVAD